MTREKVIELIIKCNGDEDKIEEEIEKIMQKEEYIYKINIYNYILFISALLNQIYYLFPK